MYYGINYFCNVNRIINPTVYKLRHTLRSKSKRSLRVNDGFTINFLVRLAVINKNMTVLILIGVGVFIAYLYSKNKDNRKKTSNNNPEHSSLASHGNLEFDSEHEKQLTNRINETKEIILGVGKMNMNQATPLIDTIQIMIDFADHLKEGLKEEIGYNNKSAELIIETGLKLACVDLKHDYKLLHSDSGTILDNKTKIEIQKQMKQIV